MSRTLEKRRARDAKASHSGKQIRLAVLLGTLAVVLIAAVVTPAALRTGM